MRTSESFGALVAALLVARSKIPALRKRGNNPDTHSKYVKLDDMVPAIVPALRDQGVLVMQSSEIVDRAVTVRTRFMLAHGPEARQGRPDAVEWIEVDCAVPLVGRAMKDGKGARHEADPQAAGSSISYARRYGLATALCLVADEDDDGRAARPRETDARPTARQRQEPQREPETLQESMDAQKQKRAFAAKAAKYVAGSFVVPAGQAEGQVLTNLSPEELGKWIDFARKGKLNDLLLDAEMALAEVMKHAAQK